MTLEVYIQDFENAYNVYKQVQLTEEYIKEIGDLSNLQPQIDAINEHLEMIRDALTLLQLDNETNKADIISLKDRINNIETIIVNLSSSVNTNTNNIASNTSSIQTNTTNIANNTTDITNNTSAIQTNTNNIASNTSAIQSNTSKINVLEGYVHTKSYYISESQSLTLIPLTDFKDGYLIEIYCPSDEGTLGAKLVVDNENFSFNSTYMCLICKRYSTYSINLVDVSGKTSFISSCQTYLRIVASSDYPLYVRVSDN